jgi:uncharacterized membrane protein
VSAESSTGNRERFTSRLEAFSDLVFGFSLSLLATRLDVPARAEDIFQSARWFAVIGTFGFVCRFWLEHYRIFRHHFVAEMFDAIVNFVFLFAIAILPYAVQTFLRFRLLFPSFALYVGDVSLILVTLAILRTRSLRQRRDDPDVEGRMRDWRRSLLQFALALFLSGFLLALFRRGGSFQAGLSDLDEYAVGGFLALVAITRLFVRRLPAFLA